jgi:homoserine O-succinyltransferase
MAPTLPLAATARQRPGPRPFPAPALAARRSDQPVVIGLVNNMPDATTTERQYRKLLATAGGTGIPTVLRLFSLPGVARGTAARAHVERHYEGFEALWAGGIDGLVVTGTEPKTARLDSEAYWPHLARLVDWAEEHTISTIWSCLAAPVRNRR